MKDTKPVQSRIITRVILRSKESEMVLKDDEYSEHVILMFSYSRKRLLNFPLPVTLLYFHTEEDAAALACIAAHK